MKKLIIIAMVLLFTGCITMGSKDVKMIKTVTTILAEDETMSPEDSAIIISIADKYDTEIVE